MNKIYIILLTVFFCANVYSQQAYFVDGYHGGIYGHYPVKWKTQFIVDQLALHPDWRCLLYTSVISVNQDTDQEAQVSKASNNKRFLGSSDGSRFCIIKTD